MKLRDIPLIVKILLTIYTFPIFALVWVFACTKDVSDALDRATQNPNEETVLELLDAYHRVKVRFTPQNHPETWAKYREIWYLINGSNRVPTHLKQQVMEKFIKEGLYLSNKKVIDNYKAG